MLAERILPGSSLAAAISDIHKNLNKTDEGDAMPCDQFLQIVAQMSLHIQNNEFGEAVKILGHLKGLFSGRLHFTFSMSCQQLLFIIIDICLLSLSSNGSVPQDVVVCLAKKVESNSRQNAPEEIFAELEQTFDRLRKGADPQSIMIYEVRD
jgi:hypothetical protein